MLELFRQRRAGGTTLARELQRLEAQAKEACSTSGKTYGRPLLAEESGIPGKTLGSWIDGRRTPQEFGKLLKIVVTLADLSGQAAPVESDWQVLWASSRKKPRARQGTDSPEDRKSYKLALWLAGAIAGAVIAGIFTPVGGDLGGWFGVGDSAAAHPPKRSSGAKSPEGLEASAAWCCRFTDAAASSGFYWPGSVDSLDAALNPMKASSTLSGLTPAGVGVIEMPLQTNSSEPIYVAPPKVQVRSRSQNPKNGIVAVIPLSGQGVAPASEFKTDVDSSEPVTVSYGAGSPTAGSSSYYYVSSGSPEILILVVADSYCDCTFDIKLTWQEQGHVYSTLLTNNGHYFRILGSAGLPWYSGSPSLHEKLRHVSGHNFSAFAP